MLLHQVFKMTSLTYIHYIRFYLLLFSHNSATIALSYAVVECASCLPMCLSYYMTFPVDNCTLSIFPGQFPFEIPCTVPVGMSQPRQFAPSCQLSIAAHMLLIHSQYVVFD